TQTVVTGAGYGGIRAAGADTNFENFLESPVTQIAGQVTDAATGNPISGASVGIGAGATATTDINGLYTLSGVAPGTYSVTAAASGYNSSTQPATVSTGVSASASFSLTSASGGNQTYIAQDTFSRGNQSGWGTASNGASWSSGSGLSISGNEGTVSNSAASQFETLGTATTGDGNGLVRFSVASTKDTAGILLRGQSSSSGLLARYDGAGNLQLMIKTGGSWTGVAKTPVTVNAGSFYWLRFLVQGTSVSMKLWPSGTQEPSAWTWTGTNSAVSGPGTMGLYAWAGSGTPVSFDSFSVASLAPPPPVLGAALTVTPQSGQAPLQVTADASASTPGAYPISTYSFNFGDGTTVGPQAAATATHTYTSNGTYTVTVTVTDTSGATSVASATAAVQSAPPSAALSVTPSSGTAPLAVTADASASTPGTNPISTYSFNFGDGTSTGAQTAATAPHTYATGGSFTVTVTVTATDGTSSTATAVVSVTSSTIA
ncbi:MAG: PKD domain-containing protein, partial [Candidatus Dormibacteria bacterium]